MGGVNLIVSCTKRKTQEPRASLRLRDLDASATTAERAAEWLRRLRAAHADQVTADSLYSGDHWKVVRAIAEARCPAVQTVRVWVCSAGYGLITPDSVLAPYDATFTPGQPDSVLRNGDPAKEALPAWWKALGAWSGPPPASCRSIASVALSHPNDFLLVALSDGYLKAVAGDLADSADSLANPEQMAIICAGADTVPGLADRLLPCDSRLQRVVGGALVSLNVRLAQRLLQTSRKELALSRCRAMFGRWMSARPEPNAPSREPMTDDQVRGFIRRSLTRDPQLRPTPLLQVLRRSGRACEHGRFARLFHEVQGLTHASR